MRTLWNRLRDWTHRDRLTSELEDELRFHRRMLERDARAGGAAPDDVAPAAARRLGNRTRIIEEIREVWSIRWLDALGRDLRYALRVLRRSAGFTTIVVITLGLGIGANTAIFSVWQGVLLPKLPYRDPEQLVAVWQRNTALQQTDKVTAGDFRDWQARSRLVDEWAFYWDTPHTLTGVAAPRSLTGIDLSTNAFSLFGARPFLGRTFLPGDGEPGKNRVAVLSHHLWESAFGADSAVVGRQMQLDGAPFEIVGVMPPEFAHPARFVDLWTPIVFPDSLGHDRQLHFLKVVARLKPGVTPERAGEEIAAIARQNASDHPQTNRNWGVEIESIRSSYSRTAERPLWILQGSVLVMLLIACANVANLLLARASTREHEVAVRLALGAGRARLFGQFVMQGMVLSLAGALAGSLLAVWGVQALPRLFETQLSTLPVPTGITEWLSWRVLGFTLLVALVIGATFGAVPALRAPNGTASTLRAGNRGSEPRVAIRLRSGLMVVQVALSFVLLVASGLLIRSFERLQTESLGFRTDRLLTLQLLLPRDRYAGIRPTASFLERALDQIRAVPGVEAAGAISTLPLTGFDARRRFAVPGEPAPTGDEENLLHFRVATPDYFRAMAVPLRRGRLFDARDREGSAPVAIINEKLARRLWPNGDPIGRTIQILGPMTSTSTIVGVVGDVRHYGLADAPLVELYQPAAQQYWPFFGIVVQTSRDPLQLRGPVEQAIWSVDASQPIDGVRTMEQLAGDSIAIRRASMLLLSVFAGVALLVASLGIYGVISYAVARRTREIGVRIALGARPFDVLKRTIGESAVLIAIGIVAGLTGALALTRYLASLLFGVGAMDTITLAIAIGTMAIVGLVATWLPARRAARVDPTVALRQE